MEDNLLVGITDRAKRKIREACKQCEEQTGHVSIPAFVWLEEILNKAPIRTGVALAFYYEQNRNEIVDDLRVVSGLECVLAIADKHKKFFDGKILDMENGHYKLIEKWSES